MTSTSFTDELALKETAKKYGLGYTSDIASCPLIKAKDLLLDYSFCKKHGMIALEKKGKELFVAVSAVLSYETIQEIQALVGCHVAEIVCPGAVIHETLEQLVSSGSRSKEVIDFDEDSTEPISVDLHDYDLLDQVDDSKVIQFINQIFLEALAQEASDIHFEPAAHGLTVRYRIDGVLQERHQAPKKIAKQILTRIKVIAKLDVAEHRRPQDGRIKLNRGAKEIDFRVSTVPIVDGERIVLRILDKSQVVLGLNHIGLSQSQSQLFSSLIHMNQGIVLVTGPTGSGKTTTLYSALSEIQSPEMNIMTVEDPVEYKLANMAQIGVNPKIDLTFARGLRHILRQDPDVIMIGEIRDPETAEIAIQASLTGHLVLSTLHTNDAPSALTRLIDMGVEPYLLTSSILGILAQRLVRKICPHCKESYEPSSAEREDLNLQPGELLHKGRGCEACYGLGYKGREAIYEVMPMTQALKKQLLRSADANALLEIARKEGMETLWDHGLEKIKQGLTTSQEVLRVTKT